MLAESGIPLKQIFYCDDVQYPEQTFQGSHGSLLVRTSDNFVVFLDALHGFAHESIKTKYADGSRNAEQFKKLLLGETSQPVHVKFPNEKRKEFGLPMSMHVMQAPDGFAGLNMMHIGLQFVHEQRPQEASYAYELGLEFNPSNTYLLSHLGLTLFQQGDIEGARKVLKKALAIDSRQLHAHFTLGEIALAEGDAKEARHRFEIVNNDRRSLYGDNSKLKHQCRAYLEKKDASGMLQFWREKQSVSQSGGIPNRAAS